MIRWESKKAREETALDKALKRYKDAFGVSYVFQFGFSKTEEEVIAEIDECISKGKKQELQDYEDDVLY